MSEVKVAFGIDIGGSGVKGALVNLETGEYIGDSGYRATPQPATPDAVALACKELLEELEVGPDIPVGITFPAPVVHNVIPFIANLDQSWAGQNVSDLMLETLERPVIALNDADAAGLAEAVYGAAKGVSGAVIVTTLGTGIGAALILDGKLWPNAELGHLEIDGFDAETQASAGQKTKHGWSYEEWIPRLQRYYSHLEMLLCPDVLIVGGGVSENHELFLPHLRLNAPIYPAALRNTAGIVGAALFAAQQS